MSNQNQPENNLSGRQNSNSVDNPTNQQTSWLKQQKEVFYCRRGAKLKYYKYYQINPKSQ